MGIPTMVVTREGFLQVVGNGFAAYGFAPEGPSVSEFPTEMFVENSDLTPLQENTDVIIYGLTQWEPQFKEKGMYYETEPVKVQGKDYQEAVDNMNYLFLSKEWGDGLPLVPATEERINWILTGTDLPSDELVGDRLAPRGGVVTVRDCAVNLAMAGGRPEYLPVVIATIDALSDPAAALDRFNTTTRNVWVGIIISGSIGKQIRVCQGSSTMGPHSLFPATGPIGRAVRLITQNLGGGVPGKGTMAQYGAMRFTNAVIAEDEDGLPSAWPTYGEERGFPRGANAVTITPLESVMNRHIGEDLDTKGLDETIEECLCAVARDEPSTSERDLKPNRHSGIILLACGMAIGLHNLGMSKDDVKQYIWDRTYMTAFPEQLCIVCAGGRQSGHTYFMRSGMGDEVVSRAIQLPANWNDLLNQAETDLGPLSRLD